MHVALFTKGQLGESNTRYAQGGLAVALGADDSPELHFQDTMAAGAGLCDEAAVRILVEQAPAAVSWLIQMGVQFDRAQAGSDAHRTGDGLLLGREAAHSRWRVLHAGGDATGAEIERALLNALKARSSVVLYEETFISNLLVQDGTCVGVEAVDRNGQTFTVASRATVLASGGAGGLWLHTSNPSGATADGLALAWRGGAALTDLEFMQFHPTVLVAGNTSHLVSEAVRGEGAYLRNHAGERFMLRYASQAELAPRDVVARAILNEMLAEKTDCQYLDLRHLPAEKMHARFPTISAICSQYGLDLARDLLPVAPAAHYCMGGVMVDSYGRTTLAGLHAVGEVACTGVQGANRLASNSLLEGLVFGLRVADGLMEEAGCPERSVGATQGSPPRVVPTRTTKAIGDATISHIRGEVRGIMWQYVSLCRDQEGLLEAQRRITELKQVMFGAGAGENGQTENVVHWMETRNMLQVAELVIAAALQRRESRGSHWRRDYEALDETLAACHFILVSDFSNAILCDHPASNGLTHALQEVIAHA
jgi:L-aspartate oxidase